MKTIGYIGGGNMARSLIGGMTDRGGDAARIMASDPLESARDDLSARFGIDVTDDNAAIVQASDILVIAVKPQVMQAVLEPVADAIATRKPLVISIAAGIEVDAMSRWLGGYRNLVRVMPNTPALVGRGAAGLYADSSVTADDRSAAESIMQAVGVTIWVGEEADIDSVTAVSGSGPAYFFYLMECMEKTAVSMGLDADTARTLTLETARGAAELAAASPDGFETLRRNVTSPGGTTEAAINTLDAGGGRETIDRAVRAAAERSRELAKTLG